MACPASPCTGDPLRSIYVNYLPEGSCAAFDDDQASCELAWQGFGQGGVSCGWKESGSGKTECQPCNGGACDNACDAPACGDPGRIWHLGPVIGGCGWFTGDAAGCELSYESDESGNLATSCYLDGASCKACTPDAQFAGDCGNSCGGPEVACIGDPSRFVDAKNTAKGSCAAFDGLEADCAKAFLSTSGGPQSCFYKPNNDSCKACDQGAADADQCVNSCEAPACLDASKTTYIGEAPSGGCALLDADPQGCNSAYETQELGNVPLSCWHTGDACASCSADAQLAGACAQTCGAPLEVCHGAPSRTLSDPDGGCEAFDESQADCDAAFETSVIGPVSCFHKVSSTGEGKCAKCVGAAAENDCANVCEAPACSTDPAVVLYTADTGCGMFDGDPAACGVAYVEDATTYTLVSCWHDGATCTPCGSGDDCGNTCLGSGPVCTGDMGRTINTEPTHAGCTFFDAEPELCAKAYSIDGGGPVACYFSGGGGGGGGKCKPCSANAEQNGLCDDVCDAPTCADDGKVWHVATCGDSADEYLCGITYTGGDGGPDACWWNADMGSCQVCAPGSADCQESCGP